MSKTIIYLKGPWAQDGTARDGEVATYALDKDRITCYENESCVGRRWWYPLQNVARVEVGK